ncbi:MAG TPA: hypothetical protein VHE53_00100 [Patescibacteria group bacterium]|nr:hypothetical protein [Patescibacteria group bacterium]
MAKADKEDKFIFTILLIGVGIFLIFIIVTFTVGYRIAKNKSMLAQEKARQESSQNIMDESKDLLDRKKIDPLDTTGKWKVFSYKNIYQFKYPINWFRVETPYDGSTSEYFFEEGIKPYARTSDGGGNSVMDVFYNTQISADYSSLEKIYNQTPEFTSGTNIGGSPVPKHAIEKKYLQLGGLPGLEIFNYDYYVKPTKDSMLEIRLWSNNNSQIVLDSLTFQK